MDRAGERLGSNGERYPNSEQFLFHYATLKDILSFVRTDRPATPFPSYGQFNFQKIIQADQSISK